MTFFQIFAGLFGLSFFATFICCDIYSLFTFPEVGLFGNFLDISELFFSVGCFVILLVKFIEAF